jgi:hypothetical protein
MIAIDAGIHYKHVHVIKHDFKRDRPRDLLIITHCEAFKHEAHLFVVSIISIFI